MDTRKKRFSIIVPAYNVERYLPACLDSLLAQTFDDFEVLVIDDVSTDNTKTIALKYAEKHPDKIQVLAHKVNTRQGGARNTAINVAVGQYLMFIDSDDYLKPNTLEYLDRVFSEEAPDIIEFCHEWVDQNGRLLRLERCTRQTVTPKSETPPMLLSTMGPCNKVYRRELFTEHGILFPEKYYYEDYWTVPKLLLQAKSVVYLDEAFYCYRQHGDSTMHDTNVQKNMDIMLGTDDLLKYFSEKKVSSKRLAELEYLAVEHVLINATLRVNEIDRHNVLQRKLREYMYDRFPNWKNNPYLDKLSPQKQKLLTLIDGQKYDMLYLRYHCRNYVTGAVKRLLRAVVGEDFIRRLY